MSEDGAQLPWPGRPQGSCLVVQRGVGAARGQPCSHLHCIPPGLACGAPTFPCSPFTSVLRSPSSHVTQMPLLAAAAEAALPAYRAEATLSWLPTPHPPSRLHHTSRKTPNPVETWTLRNTCTGPIPPSCDPEHALHILTLNETFQAHSRLIPHRGARRLCRARCPGQCPLRVQPFRSAGHLLWGSDRQAARGRVARFTPVPGGSAHSSPHPSVFRQRSP